MFKQLWLVSLGLLGFGVIPATAQADEQYDTGQKKAAVCMTCHGKAGVSDIAIYPNLQGQKFEYLVTTLKAYKRRQRTGGLALVMYEQADSLTEQDMKDISYFFSKVTSQSISEPTQSKPEPSAP
ncbi:cytochrome c [Vibrio sp. S11_S32]|uniref:c-type cytochrome n=1 Tax=Vibrio sp. S11_S32 TaxID=2720225 RepID=UPI0016815E6D|nr:cytochrome c [Vibrio sp. S11_S32]MBD1577393.1 cytochrome c [Vibrio sp. S11_S32]